MAGEPLAIDVAGAEAALAAAGVTGLPVTDPSLTNTLPSAPETPPAAPAVEATTPEPQAQTPAEETAPDFTSIPDEALTPELQQMKRSLQADYTRKMQEAAPWRKLGQELGIESPDQFRDAAEVYVRLNDPRNWPALHTELSTYMQQMGMSPVQANQAAADQLASMVPDTPVSPDEFAGGEESYQDPTTSKLLQAVTQLSQQVQQMRQSEAQREQQAQQQAEWHAAATRLTAAEAEIRAQNPHYSDDQISAIYSLMGPDGNLHAARDRFESLIGSQVAQYIASKGQAQAVTPSPIQGGQVQTTETPQRLSMDDAHAAAMAHVRQLDAIDRGTI